MRGATRLVATGPSRRRGPRDWHGGQLGHHGARRARQLESQLDVGFFAHPGHDLLRVLLLVFETGSLLRTRDAVRRPARARSGAAERACMASSCASMRMVSRSKSRTTRASEAVLSAPLMPDKVSVTDCSTPETATLVDADSALAATPSSRRLMRSTLAIAPRMRDISEATLLSSSSELAFLAASRSSASHLVRRCCSVHRSRSRSRCAWRTCICAWRARSRGVGPNTQRDAASYASSRASRRAISRRPSSHVSRTGARNRCVRSQTARRPTRRGSGIGAALRWRMRCATSWSAPSAGRRTSRR